MTGTSLDAALEAALARINTDEARGADVLPARREEIVLRTADRLSLVGELALPESEPPRATLVTLHPNPTAGGSMDSHVLRKAAARLPAQAGLAVVRFNTRGTSSPRGTSDGAFDASHAERADVAAAMAFVAERGLPNPWLVGWSFGSELAVRYGREHTVRGIALLSPPLRRCTPDELAAWADDPRPLIALVPELDEFLTPTQARERFAAVPHARVIGVDGAKHLWVGEQHTRRALSEIVRAVLSAS